MPSLVNEATHFPSLLGNGKQNHNQSSSSSSDEESNDSLSAPNTPNKRGLTDASSPESSMVASPATATDDSSPPITDAVSSQWQRFAQKESNFEALLQHSFDKISELVVSSPFSKTCIQRNAAQQQGQARLDGSTLQGAETRNDNREDSNENEDKMSSSAAVIGQVVAMEKATNALLKQEYASLESQHKDSQTQIEKLKETVSKQQDEILQAKQELQNAQQETHKYQAQAKDSRTKREGLSMQLHSLQVVVQETKKSAQLLLDQQEELTHMSRSMEEQYIQSQATSIQQQRQHSQLQKEHQVLLQDKEKLQQQVQVLQKELKGKQREIQQHWQQSVKTLEQKQVWNIQRIESLEDELQKSRTLTLEALTTTAKSVETSKQLQTELASLQSTLEESQQETKVQQDQAKAELDENNRKCQSQYRSNQKLMAQLKQVQHQRHDFRLELQVMEQLLQDQRKSAKQQRGSTSVASAISPTTTTKTTTSTYNNSNNNHQVLCAHKCNACQLPNLGGGLPHHSTTNPKAMIISPTANTAAAKNAKIRIVQSTPPLYVCLHCIQAIAQPILANSPTSSKTKKTGKSNGRKRRSTSGDEASDRASKKAAPDSGSGKEAAVIDNPTSLSSADATSQSNSKSTAGVNKTSDLEAAPLIKTRLTSAVARMVGPSTKVSLVDDNKNNTMETSPK
ncbi:MAG: hypothetical protein SGBAC_004923 [Bacillariaceae sp.]